MGWGKGSASTPGGASAWGSVTGTLSDQLDLQSALDGKAALAHSHLIAGVTGLQAILDLKAASSHTHSLADITDEGALAAKNTVGTNDVDAAAVTNAKLANMATKTYKGRTSALTGVPEDVAVATLKTDLGLVKGDVGLGNVDNTTDAGKPVSTAQQTAIDGKVADAINDGTTTVAPSQNAVFDALALKAPLASPALTGVPTAPTAAAGTNTTQVATTAFVTAINNNAVYDTLLEASGSHIAGRVAGTYGLGHGDPVAITGTGTLYPLQVIRIDSADYPTINGLAPKFRTKSQVFVNDVAPTGNFTFGLYPITRPGTSGGAGLNIYTLGTVVVGSTGAINTPAADSMNTISSSDFALPADGYYALGVVTTATVAVSSHLHMNSKLQVHNA